MPLRWRIDTGLPTPFMPKEPHRPDRLPGTPAHAALKQITDQLDTDKNLADNLASFADRGMFGPQFTDSDVKAIKASVGDLDLLSRISTTS